MSSPFKYTPLALAVASTSLLSLLPISAQAAVQPIQQAAQQETILQIDIVSGSLSSALNKLASLSNIALSYKPQLTAGKKTLGLTGSYTLKSALNLLLSDSGLQANKQANGDYIIEKQQANNIVGTLALTKINSVSETVTENSNSYTVKSMNTSTKMQLDVIDTPQSTSVITSKTINDFQLTSINRILDNAVGITVEKMESDRTQFTSRGFEIKNFLIDGLSLPLNYSYQYGDIDMAIFDHVEITRGATGLATANGDPSATINMVRKRPTAEFQGEAKLSLGSWRYKRADADISGALNDDKSVRARAIFSLADADSYLDRYETDSNLMSVIVEADISDKTLLTAGVTRYEDNNKGSQWGGIPAFDGNDYDVSTNATSTWAYRNVITTDVFAELKHSFSDNWQLTSTYAYKDIDQDAQLMNLWMYGDSLELDGAQQYQLTSKEHLFNVTLNGFYTLFNREHEVVVGVDLANRDIKENSDYDQDILGTVIDLTTWDGTTATPVFDDRNDGTDYSEKQSALFFATNFHLLDNLNLLLGSRMSNWTREGVGYWDSSWDSEDKGVITPYAALLYKVTDNVSTYVSYTKTFKPQSSINESGQFIDPAEGINYEIGVKSAFFDDTLNGAVAYFVTSQENVAEWGGRLDDGRTFYIAVDGVESKGFEIELS
ncbi:MAG: TonB-dependent siderophore receptor, partial [Paraglaciecola sp.]|nr:TonB-dependent siderophore receptor [Paraglaciecola sp.]